MDRPTCETCLFWHARNSDFQGECRRHPPGATVLRYDTDAESGEIGSLAAEYNTHWPMTDASEWCGEHPQFDTWRRLQPYGTSAKIPKMVD